MHWFRSLKHFFQPPVGNSAASAEQAGETSAAELERAGAHWGERAQAQATATRASSWTECPVVATEYMNPLISGQPHVGWLEAVAKTHFPTPVHRALSLGCGGGGLERHGLQLQIAEHFDGFDVSEGAVALAQSLAAESGQNALIDYQVANLNKLAFDANCYDAVFASQSIHHIQDLEHYFAQIRHTLRPGGLFIFNEFIGPNQFQWTDAQLQHANRLLGMIPESMRRLIREEGIKQQVERPTLEFMNAYDPTEAIRSADIMPGVQEHFTVLWRKDFGGTLLHLVLDNIAGNLNSSAEGLQLLRYFFGEEQRLIAAGELTSDFTVVVARNHSEKESEKGRDKGREKGRDKGSENEVRAT